MTLAPAAHCKPFPEAQVGASGNPFAGAIRGGKVFGFVDDHLHITANSRAGGLVISGQPFSPFGIPTALGEDAKVHGKNGSLDYTGNLLRSASPVGTHDTQGWPTFNGWPTFDTQTHQQTYYVWLQRAWEAGERLLVAQTAEDQPLCRLESRRDESCNETTTIKAEIRALRGLQNYVDAQNGGPGRGWFRLVYSPAQARRVIAGGKLAVIIGIESSDLFGCSERDGKAQCTRADINRGLSEYKRLGVRGMFVAHWVNNAFGGAALEGGAKGIFINILNRLQTGSYFTTGTCPGAGQGVTVSTLPVAFLQFLSGFFPSSKPIAGQPMPTYPPGLQCNTDGLTPLGRYLIKQLIAQHMLIEVDHLSERARDTVLTIAEHAHYPLISSHNGTGGEWTPAELTRLYKLGGFAAVTPDQAPALASKIIPMSRYRNPKYYFGVGIGTDTGGFSLAARAALRRGDAAAALSVQVLRREGYVHARADRDTDVRPEPRRGRPVRSDGRSAGGHAARTRGCEGDVPAVPLGRGLSRDLAAGGRSQVARPPTGLRVGFWALEGGPCWLSSHRAVGPVTDTPVYPPRA